ncbi:MAG: LytTR family DNA-binding domain-containing protein [Acutalibacteraceae bacterium]|nr:LytTR family DNA-binding domain-containing protein [Acutalibacteraceae bacterium]
MFIAICDDNSLEKENVSNMLDNYFLDKGLNYKIDDYENGINLIYEIQDGTNYDLIILYIQDYLGIEIARDLRKMNYNGKIIFITNTAEFAVASYEVEATGYLLKPYSYKKLCTVMDRVIKDYEINIYRIRQRNSMVKVTYKDILYVESNNSKCILHSDDGNNYTIYKKLNKIEEELNDSRFLRCHQSYLVNMDCICKADKQFEVSNGDTVNIRQRNLKSIKQIYFDYINNKNL